MLRPLKQAAIIEFYGPTIRIGVEGKWVEFISRDMTKPKPSRRELLSLIEAMDKERTQ